MKPLPLGRSVVAAFLCLGIAACGAPPDDSGAGEEPPAHSVEPPPTAMPGPDAPRASRSFFGPHTYPPEDFAAYGIVAFPERAIAETRERHMMACKAYVATLPTPGELTVARTAQMVTVWPVDDDGLAADLMRRRGDEACADAVDRYHLATALEAIGQASRRHALGNRDGPFLLAWAPAAAKGEPDAPVLVADLSTATTQAQFNERFRGWRSDIEANPELWDNGWSVEGLRRVVRAWADRYGPAVLRFWES